MGSMTLEGAFGFADQRVMDTLRPKPQPIRLPFWPLVLVVISVTLAGMRSGSGGQPSAFTDNASFVLAGLGVAWLAGLLEERLFLLLRQAPVAARFVGALVAISVGFGGGALLALALGQIPRVGERLAALVFLFAIWLASAALGSVLMLVLDVVLRTLVADFRRRIVIAVLTLVALASGLCALIVLRAPAWVASLHTSREARDALRSVGYSISDLPFANALFGEASGVALGAFVAAAVVALPAIVSVCSKLAETVTERLPPLIKAFDRVAEGDRSVHLEEAGSQEFFTLALSFNEMVDKLYLAERIERAFGQYVSSQVLDRIRAQRGSVRLPAELRTASVFFADIRGFTPISERLTPAGVVDLLNRYLDQVVPVVEEYQGFLNKFIGDAVVVVFNGPLEQVDHAERATRCAIAVQQRVAELNLQGAFAEVGELAIGIGVATGPMLCGNVGTKSRLEYTVIGDTVNLASRMTSHARGGEVWVSELTAQMLPETIVATPFTPIKFKGKDNSVVPYTVWPPIQPGTSEERGRS